MWDGIYNLTSSLTSYTAWWNLRKLKSLINFNTYHYYLLFCWPCIIVYEYSETNVMHFLFSLIRIKGITHIRSLPTKPTDQQPYLNKNTHQFHLNPGAANWHNTVRTKYLSIYKNYCVFWKILFNILSKVFNIMKLYWQIFHISIEYLML
jgi:hypothetical protein